MSTYASILGGSVFEVLNRIIIWAEIEGREGGMVLAPLSAGFQSLPLLPTIKLSPSGANSWMGGFVYILGHCGSLQ